jgi:hypothetical protein
LCHKIILSDSKLAYK